MKFFIGVMILTVMCRYSYDHYKQIKLDMFRAGCTYVDAPAEEITKCRNRAEAYMEGLI